MANKTHPVPKAPQNSKKSRRAKFDLSTEQLDQMTEYEESIPQRTPFWMIVAGAIAIFAVSFTLMPYLRERWTRVRLRNWADDLNQHFKVAA